MATKKARLKNSGGDYIIPYVPVDSELSSTSENPVQNKVINTALSGKQATLVSGTNIKTINNQSLLGSGNIDIQGGSGGSYTAGDGIIIQNDEISVNAESIQEVDVEEITEVDTVQPTLMSISQVLATITGYDANETQTLKNINGILTWVTD